MKNKILRIALCVITLCLILCSCGARGDCTHENRAPVGEGKAASCTEAGLTSGEKCADCGVVFEEQQEIAALGHTEVIDQGKLADCKNTGLTEGKHCAVCGEVTLEQKEIQKSSHSPATAVKENVIDSDCTTNGSYDKVCYCVVCGEVASSTPCVIPAKGHNYDDDYDKQCNDCDFIRDINCSHANVSAVGVAVAATCTEDGITAGEKCDDCGDIITPQQTVEATGHTEQTVLGKAATCTETGLTDGVQCSVCKEMLTKQEEISATGHTNASAVQENVVQNNCTNGGSYDSVVYCSVCSAEVSRETVSTDPAGHTEQTVLGKAATCTETGLTDGVQCSVCYVFITAQEEIGALGHTYDDDSDEICNVCDFTRDITCSHENKVAVGEAKEATCTEDGITAGEKCADCGEVFTEQSIITASGHSYESVVTDPDCENAGYTTYTCSVCSDSYKVDGAAALGHSYESVVTDPDCENAGYTTYTCSVCSDSYKVNGEAATGHSYTWRVSVMPTDLIEGQIISTNTACAVCSAAVETVTKAIPAVSSNDYTYVATGAASIWHYEIDGQTIAVALAETDGVSSYRFDVNESSDPTNEQNENNPFIEANGGSRSDSDGTYGTESSANGLYRYGSGRNAVLTTTIYVEEATVVSFKLICDSRAGSGVFSYYPANGTGGTYYPYIQSLTLNGVTDGVVPSLEQYSTLGWNKFQDSELAVLYLKPGVNVVSFQIGGDNINYAGIAVDSVIPVTLLAPTTDTFKVADADPFATENGGSSGGLSVTTHSTYGSYYEASYDKTMTVTVYADEDTTVDFYLYANTRFSGVSTLTTVSSIKVNGSADGVTRHNNSISATGWNTSSAVRVLYATLELKAGINEITFTRTSSVVDENSNQPNNINISGVEFVSKDGVSLTKSYAFDVDTETGDQTNDPFIEANGGSNTESANLKLETIYRYGDGNEAELTVTICVEEATQVIFKLNAAWRQSDSSLGVTLGQFGYYPADGTGGRCYPYVTNFTLNGSTDGVTPLDNSYGSVGWFKMTACSLAVLDLQAGANVISFKIAGDNINYTGITVVSVEAAPVTLYKTEE